MHRAIAEHEIATGGMSTAEDHIRIERVPCRRNRKVLPRAVIIGGGHRRSIVRSSAQIVGPTDQRAFVIACVSPRTVKVRVKELLAEEIRIARPVGYMRSLNRATYIADA